MESKFISNKKEYDLALKEASALVDLDPDADTPEGLRLEYLTKLIQSYEAIHFHVGDSQS